VLFTVWLEKKVVRKYTMRIPQILVKENEKNKSLKELVKRSYNFFKISN